MLSASLGDPGGSAKGRAKSLAEFHTLNAVKFPGSSMIFAKELNIFDFRIVPAVADNKRDHFVIARGVEHRARRRAHRIPGPAGAVDLVRPHRQTDFRSAAVARYDFKVAVAPAVHHLGQLHGIASPGRAHAEALFGLHDVVPRFEAGEAHDRASNGILARRADPAELAAVDADAGIAHHVVEHVV